MVDVPKGYKGFVVGNTIPMEYYRTTGTGESPHQIHAGSYHDAMRKARVELGNLVVYTSILPKIANEIPIEEGVQRVPHGSELKVIQAAAHIDLLDPEVQKQGHKSATAAVVYGFLHPKGRRRASHEGGLVCEYNGYGTADEAVDNLKKCLKDLHEKPNAVGFKLSEKYELRIADPLSATVEPKERYGTAFAGLAFVSFLIPLLGQNVFNTDLEAIVALSSSDKKFGSP